MKPLNKINKPNISKGITPVDYLSIFSGILTISPLAYTFFTEQKITLGTIGLCLFFYFITDRLALIFSDREKRVYLSNFVDYVSDNPNVIPAGDRESAMKLVRAKASDIHVIRNTHFVLDEKLSHSRDEINAITQLFMTVLLGKGEVIDIAGGLEKTKAMKAHEEVRSELRDANGDYIPGYRPFFMSANTPIINYMLLEFKDSYRPKEVYFGWGAHEGDPRGVVYFSDDVLLYDLFLSHFEAIRHSSHTASLGQNLQEKAN